MRHHTTAVLGVALLCSASLPALAQSERANCTRLQQVTEQNRNRFNMEWVRQAEAVIQSGDDETCQRFAEQAEVAARQLDQQAQSQPQSQSQGQQQAQDQEQAQQSGEIMVRQPQPEVTVQQQAPQVQVTQPAPQVSVNQQQPQIIVRQAPPVVRLQMPQPVITIDQPEPEIIVRMPPPQVAVTTPEPQVRVTQPQPEVQVRQPQPQVQVQMQQPEVNVQQSRQAEVRVQREQPVIELQQQGKADVQVSQQQPEVSFEAAQPRVEVQQSGEPKVEFRQSGKAQVRVEQMQGQSGQQQNGEQQQNQQQQASNATQADQPTGSTSRAIGEQDRQRIGLIRDGQPSGQAAEIQASELQGKPVLNRQGDSLGTIQSIRRQGNRDYAVISHGGALELSQTEFLVPTNRLTVDGQGRIMLMGLTQQEADAIPRMLASAGEEISGNDAVRISRTQQQ